METIEAKIVEAVGIAHSHGPSISVRGAIRRNLQRLLVWISFRGFIPLTWRQWMVFRGIPWVAAKCRYLMFQGATIGNTFENEIMLLIFNATAIANLADNAATSPFTQIAVALHTADPGEAGTMATSEVTYTSYARVNVNRNSGGWTVTNNSVSPVANISFPAGTGGSGTASFFSVGATGGGASRIFFSGTVTPNIVTGNGVTPILTTASTITID